MQSRKHARALIARLVVGSTAILLASASRVAADDGALCVRGSGNAAIEACTRAINSGRYDPRNLAIIYSNRALKWEGIENYERAVADHGEALRLDPSYAGGFMHRGNMYARRGDFERAIADHSTAVRLAPNDADTHYNRGLTFSRKGDHELAIADYTKGIELDAGRSQLWGQRCWSRAMLGRDLQAALEDCNKARSLSPQIPQILAYRGLLQLKLGAFDKALEDYDGALALTKNPNNAEWLHGRGVAKAKRGDQSGADADLAAAKAIRPNIAEEFAKWGVQ